VSFRAERLPYFDFFLAALFAFLAALARARTFAMTRRSAFDIFIIHILSDVLALSTEKTTDQKI
jgi:hypothetical protein